MERHKKYANLQAFQNFQNLQTMKWYFPSLEFTMEEQFQEDWDTECDICLDRNDFFVLKHCVCSTMVCMECYYAIQATKGAYLCPGCRDVPPPVEKLTEAQIVVARWNWIRAFDEQEGAQLVKGVLTGSRVDDRRAVQELLNTGPFTWNRGAGVCLDREAARVFVGCQLHRLSQTTFWTIQNQERDQSESDSDYDEAAMETVPSVNV